MKTAMFPKGSRKTIRLVKTPIPQKKTTKALDIQKEEKAEGVEVQVGDETHQGMVAQIMGPCRVIASADDPRIETYAEVALETNLPRLSVFIVSSDTHSLQVIAVDEGAARLMHPLHDMEWDPRKKTWRDEKGVDSGVYQWPAPAELRVKIIGTDEFAEVAERLHFWKL